MLPTGQKAASAYREGVRREVVQVIVPAINYSNGTCLSLDSSLLPHAELETNRCEAGGTMYPILVKRQAKNREVKGVSASVRRKGARLSGMVNVSELLINSVKYDKPKTLTGLNQNGKWSANPVPFWITGTSDHRKIDRT